MSTANDDYLTKRMRRPEGARLPLRGVGGRIGGRMAILRSKRPAILLVWFVLSVLFLIPETMCRPSIQSLFQRPAHAQIRSFRENRADAPRLKSVSPDDDQVVSYRRWLVPLERIADWPIKDGSLVPDRRERFERWTEILKRAGNHDAKTPDGRLERIVLEARLEGRQLIEGRGFFDFNRRHSVSASIPLNPWNLWIDSPRWSDGSPAVIGQTEGGESRLWLSSKSAKSSPSNRIHFNWSLRCRTDLQGRLQFDFEMPDCMSLELNLLLPAFMIPSTSVGIVLPVTEQTDLAKTTGHAKTTQAETPGESSIPNGSPPLEKFRRWRILLGRHSKTTVGIAIDEKRVAAQQMTAFRIRTVYHVTPQGTDVTDRIFFDKADAPVNELLLELESPLRPIEITYGERPISWILLSTSENDHAMRIHLDLSGGGKSDSRELIVKSIAPVFDRRDWTLPRIRVASPNLFWSETRCGIVVQNPLILRTVDCDHGVRVAPLTALDASDREVFAFQFFRPDARVAVNLDYRESRVSLDSATRIQWSNNEMTGDMTVECAVRGDELYSVELPVSPHWTINTVKTSTEDLVLSWDVIESKTKTEIEKTSGRLLSVQLKRPLRPKEIPLRFQITGRFMAPAMREFTLGDISPLALPYNKEETHFVAIQLEPPYHWKNLSPGIPSPEFRDLSDPRLIRLYGAAPQGTLFRLETRNRDLHFSMEKLTPVYSGDVDTTVVFKERELTATYRFSFVPSDSNVDRVYVHFSSPGPADKEERPADDESDSQANTIAGNKNVRKKEDNEIAWLHRSGANDFTPFQARRLLPKEQEELFPAAKRLNRFDGDLIGECWEIRLVSPQSTMFEFQAVRTIPLTDVLPIPLASMPLATSQKGAVRFESMRFPEYHIINSRLVAIPIPVPEGDRYREVRAAFRYDPSEEFRFQASSPLLLKRVAKDDLPPAAWAWSLRLDTQYESEGIVKNNVLLLLENKGKKNLRITLPEGVGSGDVHAVWLDDNRITWHPEQYEDSSPTASNGSGDKPATVIVVTLPERRRFVTVSLEYSFQDVPLTRHRHLNPRYPKVDVPVLAGNWTSWFPPEFDVGTGNRTSRNAASTGFQPIRAMDYYLARQSVNPFSRQYWNRLFYGKSNRLEAIRVSKTFLNWLAFISGKSSTAATDRDAFVLSPGGMSNAERKGSDPSWADLFDNERLLFEMLGQNIPPESGLFSRPHPSGKSDDASRFHVMIDRRAFEYYGISPATSVSLMGENGNENDGADILQQNGLALLVSTGFGDDGRREYTFYLTSFLMLAVHRHFDSEPIGNGIRFVSDENRLYENSSKERSERTFEISDIGFPEWISLDDWIRETPPVSFPWSISSQVVRLASITPDWFACDISRGQDNSLYIIHRGTYDVYHLLAFLFAIVLTWKRPFSSPLVLVGLLVVLEIGARWIAPCHAGIPCGAFLGVLVSLCFALIRKRVHPIPPTWTKGRLTSDSQEFAPPVPGRPMTETDDQAESADRSGADSSINEDVLLENRLKKSSGSKTKPRHFIETDVFFRQFVHDGEKADSDGKNDQDAPKDSETSGSSGTGSVSIWIFLLMTALLSADSKALGEELFANPPANSIVSKDAQSGAEIHFESPGGSATVENETVFRTPSERIPPESTAGRQGDWQTFSPEKRREPFRVFYPTDGSQKIVGDFVWIPERFFHWLYRQIQVEKPEEKHRWSIDRAIYEGTLTDNSLNQGLAVAGLKATFEIILHENNATITLPPMPLIQDGATWNSVPIQPVWLVRENAQDSPGTGQENSVLTFSVENERKGRHVLELSLDPKLIRTDHVTRIEFAIPKIPNSTLTLHVPIDAPAINVADCFGAVKTNSISSPTLEAGIGPSGKLAFYWIDEAAQGDAATIEVDSMFRMRTRPMLLRTKFRFRIDGGKVRHVNLSIDPRWQLSGQFHCEEFPIDRVETHYAAPGAEGAFLTQREVTRLVFKTPVSGTVTVQAAFMLRDFSGIGNVRLPQIRAVGARNGKSMLAVHSDPLLELDLPKDGLGTGFESLWYSGSGEMRSGISTAFPNTSIDGTSESSGIPMLDRPEAVYDLEKVSPTWVVSIRMKKEKPTLTLNQSFGFDFGDSVVRSVADFETPHEVFQQAFSVPDSLRIESVDVRDMQNNPVEIRWTKTRTTSKHPDGTRTETMIFFKRPLTGSFRIGIVGSFPSETEKERSEGNRPTVKRKLPELVFENAILVEQRLEFFRSSTVLAELDMDPSAWQSSEALLVSRAEYSDMQPVSAWKRLFRKTKANKTTPPSPKPLGKYPGFLLSVNRPIIRAETITSLSHDPDRDSWETTFDLLWTISHGELNSIRLQWDERCGSVLAVEPPMTITLEPKDGRMQLLLTPDTPLTGKRHIRIRTIMNPSAGSVSAPTIRPILENSFGYSSRNYVILPRQSNGLAIPWNYSMLTPVDEDTRQYLERLVSTKLGDGRENASSTTSILTEPIPGSPFLSSLPPFSLSGAGLMPLDPRPVTDPVFLQATADDFTASITRKSERPTAILCDVNIFVRKNGALFGIMTLDLKSQGQDSCILALPPNYRIIQLTSSGVTSEGSRLMDRRWKIDLYASDYPKRVGVIFRGSLASREGENFGDPSSFSHDLRSKIMDGRIETAIPLPVVENVDVQETLWTLSFESSSDQVPPLLAVSSVREEAVPTDDPTVPFRKQDVVDFLGRTVPLTGQDASQTLIKLDVVRLNNLLLQLDLLPNSRTPRLEEIRSWTIQWKKEWNSLLRMIDYQRHAFPRAMYADEHFVLLDPPERRNEKVSGRKIDEFLDFMKPTENSLRALLMRKDGRVDIPGLLDVEDGAERSRLYSSGFLVHTRSRMNETSSHLFGAQRGGIKEIRLASVPDSAEWADRLLRQLLIWVVIPITCLVLAYCFRIRELFLQFPHYWGVAGGLLLWSLFPPSLTGAVVILLVLLSGFYRPWPYREREPERNGMI